MPKAREESKHESKKVDAVESVHKKLKIESDKPGRGFAREGGTRTYDKDGTLISVNGTPVIKEK